MKLLLLLLVLLPLPLLAKNSQRRPHILLLVVDDLGWNDVGFRVNGTRDIPTPNIDKLASEGIILNNYYVQPMCSPSRASLLTGRYAYSLGLAHGVISNGFPKHVGLDETMISEKFKTAGYVTALLGKWDVGMTSWPHTPTRRGFDHFLGYYNAYENYYSHRAYAQSSFKKYDAWDGIDLRNGTAPYQTPHITYSTHIYTQEAMKIIRQHWQQHRKSLFMMVSYQAIHVPLEVPKSYLANCSHITDAKRLITCGMMQTVDESVGQLVAELDKRRYLNNTIIVFTTDNGADVLMGGNNWPLRGSKETVWEGGVRGAAFVWNPRRLKGGWTSNALMHITDWMPTLLKMARINSNTSKPLDGINVWPALRNPDVPSPRTEILLQLDPPFNNSVNASADAPLPEYENSIPEESAVARDQTHTQDSLTELVETDSDGVQVVRIPARFYDEEKGCVNNTLLGGLMSRMKFFIGQAAIRVGDMKLIVGQPNCSKPCLPEHQCPSGWFPVPPALAVPPIYNDRMIWLFNITADPSERNDLSLERPDIVAQLQQRLHVYRAWHILQSHPNFDPASNPALFDGWWTPWRRADEGLRSEVETIAESIASDETDDEPQELEEWWAHEEEERLDENGVDDAVTSGSVPAMS